MSDEEKVMQTVRELATNTSDIKHIQSDMDKMGKDIEEIKEALREICKTLAEVKGGWHMLVIVGSIGASAGAFATWLFDFLKH